jgi:hypothetical protein
MGWLVIWLYFVIGELTVLWVLSGAEKAANFQWLAEEKWWVPYAGTIAIVIAWPAVVALLVLVPKIK